jgi:hypothetical protein
LPSYIQPMAIFLSLFRFFFLNSSYWHYNVLKIVGKTEILLLLNDTAYKEHL